MPTTVVVVGNPKPQSRTLVAARTVAAEVHVALGIDQPVAEVDLATIAFELFDHGSRAVEHAVDQLRGANLAVIASPVYKASYSGLLKSFLDRIGQGELHDVVAIPLMVGAAPAHALAVELHLRPLLVELGAPLPTRGLYVLESELASIGEVAASWLAAESHAARLAAALGAARAA